MRRLALLTGALTVMASLAVGASATASATSRTRQTHPNPAIADVHGVLKNGAVTSGSQWSLLYYGWEGSGDLCETLTFARHTFTGDNTSTGTWSGNIKLTFTGGIDYQAGDVYKGKVKKSGTYSGDFVGPVTYKGTSYSPFVLKSGAFC
jgi:hypothetical protein